MDWGKVVGRNIRRFRKQRGYTQEQLALEAAVDLRYLGGIERGDGNPSVELLGKICAVLDIHPSKLFEQRRQT